MLANLGPVATPQFQPALWLLCAGVEALLVERLLRRWALPKGRVQQLALIVNLLSWPLFIFALDELGPLARSVLDRDAAFVAAFTIGELGVVVAEGLGLRLLLRRGLPSAVRDTVPSTRWLLAVSLVTNLVSIAVWLVVVAVGFAA